MPDNADNRFHLSPGQYRAALSLVRAMIPPGKRIPGAGPQTVTRLMAFLEDMGHPALTMEPILG